MAQIWDTCSICWQDYFCKAPRLPGKYGRGNKDKEWKVDCLPLVLASDKKKVLSNAKATDPKLMALEQDPPAWSALGGAVRAYSYEVKTNASAMAAMQPYCYGIHEIEISFKVKESCSGLHKSDDLESEKVSEARVW